MAGEENIKQKLAAKFGYLGESITVPRARRISLTVDQGKFGEVFDYAVKELKFCHLCTITGLDEGDKLSFIYHLSQDEGVLLNLKISVPKENPVIRTVVPYFPGADIYEREVVDLLGAKVEGLAPGRNYPLTDGWPAGQYPLRKDWKASGDAKKEADTNA